MSFRAENIQIRLAYWEVEIRSKVPCIQKDDRRFKSAAGRIKVRARAEENKRTVENTVKD